MGGREGRSAHGPPFMLRPNLQFTKSGKLFVCVLGLMLYFGVVVSYFRSWIMDLFGRGERKKGEERRSVRLVFSDRILFLSPLSSPPPSKPVAGYPLAKAPISTRRKGPKGGIQKSTPSFSFSFFFPSENVADSVIHWLCLRCVGFSAPSRHATLDPTSPCY